MLGRVGNWRAYGRVGECAKLAKYLRNRAPGLVLAQKSVLPRLEALAEPWSVQAVSLGCICWYLVRELHKRPAHARRRALSRHLLGAYRLGPADGIWGARTGKAYRAFLRDAGLPTAEMLTPEALRALRAIAKRRGGDAEAKHSAVKEQAAKRSKARSRRTAKSRSSPGPAP